MLGYSIFISLLLVLCCWIKISSSFYMRNTYRSLSSIKYSLHMSSKDAKLPKVEGIKERSNYLRDPLEQELQTDEIFINHDAAVILKYHGSYMQDNRDNRKKGEEKEYQFMLRLKAPGGEITSNLYQLLDGIADEYGQGDLRATTRQAFQLHGIIKGDLKTVVTEIMKAGSSTIGACGDVSRNVMCPAAPFNKPEYRFARQYASVLAELFKPQSNALSEIWLGSGETKEKVADMEYWFKNIHETSIDVKESMLKDSGTGIILSDKVEPLYGKRYLPRKFKMAVTVPGDNSVDIYTNDVGLVVITNQHGELEGFNVMVGGGMGRTHNKETTFARVADHLGFVKKEDVLELCKAILATQRDHGNRDIRPNARMKYLVHEVGIEKFKGLVETYFGKPIVPWRDICEWKYEDWMGWHEQGDGKLFLGINIESGRVRDIGNVRIKTALKHLIEKFSLDMILTPSQSVILRDISPSHKTEISSILEFHGISNIEAVDSLTRLSIACPALPLCGLAITEAERRMPEWNTKMRNLLNKVGLGEETLITRMTGCPNGCARPYMAELALVGDGPESYQIWIGGSPGLTRLAIAVTNKVNWDDIDNYIEQLLIQWRDNRIAKEAFGDYFARSGVQLSFEI